MNDIISQPKELTSRFDLKGRGAIVVDGATGYLGSHLVAALSLSGAEIRCLVHKGAKAEDINVLKNLGAKIIVGDLIGADIGVVQAFKDASVAVHLIGSIAPKKGSSHKHLHYDMTESFVEKAKAAGAQSALMVTALGTRADAPSQYHATKYLAEQVLQESGMPSMILRPSLLIGRQVGRRNSKLVERLLNVMEKKKAVPLVNGGVNKLQPLFIGDMAMAAVAAIERLTAGHAAAQPLELGGSEVVTMHDLVSRLMSVRGLQKPILTLPYPMAMAAASICQVFQEVPVISCDQVKLSMRDNICTDNRIEELLGAKPMPLSTALQVYSPK